MRLTMLLRQAVEWLQLHLREACYAAAGALLVLQCIAAFVSPSGAWSLCIAAIACIATANLDRIGKIAAPGEIELALKEARDSAKQVGELLRMSVRAQLEMTQRLTRKGAYSDAEIYRQGGQGGFEIRTFAAAAAAAKGARGTIEFCEPIPVFAVSCTIARMQIAA